MATASAASPFDQMCLAGSLSDARVCTADGSRGPQVDEGEDIMFDPAKHAVDWAPSPDEPGLLVIESLQHSYLI